MKIPASGADRLCERVREGGEVVVIKSPSMSRGAMHFVRGLNVAVRQQVEEHWSAGPWTEWNWRKREVADCRVAVIGAGGNGNGVAQRFSTLGCTRYGVRRRPALGVPAGLKWSLVLTKWSRYFQAGTSQISAPPTAATRKLMNAKRLALLPDGAIVVNVYAVRYWMGERLVLVTPHGSGVSPARHWDRTLTLSEENWRLWNEGKGLRNIVDAEAGY